MIDDRDFETLVDEWISSGSDRTPPELIQAVRFAVRTTPQEQTLAALRRPLAIRGTWRFAAVFVAIAILGSISWAAANRPSVGASERPDATPSGTPGRPTPPPPTGGPSGGPTAGRFAPSGYPGSGTISFSRGDAAGVKTTWLVDPSGTRETPIGLNSGPAAQGGSPNLSGAGCCGVFSADGRRIAVGYTELDGVRGPGSLDAGVVLNLDGTVAESIPGFCGGCSSTDRISYSPRAWSPDGSWIANELWSDASPSRDGINLAPMGTNARTNPDWSIQVTGAHLDVPLDFSPDSKDLLFIRVTTDDGRGSLMKLRVGSGTITTITPPGRMLFADDYFGPSATWSPDGTQIAYAATDATGSTTAMEVFVANADGTNAKALISPATFVTAANWSPDGRWIAFDQPIVRGLHGEFVIRPDGTGLTSLTDGFNAGVCCARWSPESTTLLVAGTLADNLQSQLLIVPVDGSAIAQVTSIPGFYSAFSWGAATR